MNYFSPLQFPIDSPIIIAAMAGAKPSGISARGAASAFTGERRAAPFLRLLVSKPDKYVYACTRGSREGERERARVPFIQADKYSAVTAHKRAVCHVQFRI